uniref:Coagulation factor V n=1 Tax=Xiphophorus couchianus TaxID=32473 RepID=A0A3B5MK47_9TELE
MFCIFPPLLRQDPTYKKVVFREYDENFSQAKTHPPWLGLLGPTLRAEEGETIVVTFRNMAYGAYSIHPHGVAYGKQSEGANYFDNTSQKEKEDDIVQPNGEHVYTWEVTPEVSPLPDDPDCLTYTYISHQNVVQDYNSGLIGALLICKAGTLDESGQQTGLHKEFVFLFGVFDEKESLYTPSGHSSDDHVKYTINGYTRGSLPAVSICAHAPVSLHLVGMSSEPEVFSVHMNGQVLTHSGHKVSSVGLISGSSASASLVSAYAGRWLLSSFTTKHMEAGMHGFVDVRTCEEFKEPVRRMTISQQRQSKEWKYYIAAEEIVWDYSKDIFSLFRDFKLQYLTQSARRIGAKYKKAVYTLYKNESFTEKVENEHRKNELGILGPVIRANSVIIFCRLDYGFMPYSIYPHGLTVEKSEEGVNYPEGGNQTHGVRPGETHTYVWKVLEENEPLDGDSRCLTRMYHSAVDTPRDIASGLIGPMLICKSQSLDVRNVQLRADKEQHAVFSVFDENKSWYLDENIRRCYDQSKVNKADPDFYKSNVMHTINGYVFESGPDLGFCYGEVPTWHVSSIGAQDYIQTATFYGHSFELNHRTEDILSLYPMTGETIKITMDNIGFWLLASLNTHQTTKGMRVKFQDVECYRDLQYEYEENDMNRVDEFTQWKPPTFEDVKKEKEKSKSVPTEPVEVDMYTDMFADELGLRSLRNQSSNSDEEELINFPIVIALPRPDFSDYQLYAPGDEPEKTDMNEQDVTQNEYEYVSYKDPYSSHEDIKNLNLDETTKYYLKLSGPDVRTYFIAAEEVEWDYAGYGQRHDKSQQNMLETKFTKVVFRGYLDASFSTPDLRGEMDEHLGILGPVIKAEVGQSIMNVFKNNANRPYSLHPNGVFYTKQFEGLSYEDGSKHWYKYDNEVQPNTTYTYIWKISPMVGPAPEESECRTWAYYSGVNPEKDIHSGLIGPLLVCREGTLKNKPLNTREFVLLFMTFDESQSWYYNKNQEVMKQLSAFSVFFYVAINGIIYSLKGLRMYTNQLVRWHLINMGSPKDVHSVYFHGQTFQDVKTKRYRQAVFPLLPGGFATLEMYPSKPGLWQLETEVGLNQKKGMQTLFLILDNDCYHPMGLESGSVKNDQITASNSRGNWAPHLARLNNQGKYNAWSTDKKGDWIQVDFKRPVVISQVATQGAWQFFRSQYATNFSISYSNDRRKWIFYKGDSREFWKTFQGNEEASQTKKNTFFPPLIGRFIRLHPITWNNAATIRMEFYGCELDGCSVPLGMESGLIEDRRITASSEETSWFSGHWKASLSRLNKQGSINAWRAKVHSDMNQWLQVELPRIKKITGIITQGAKSMMKEMYVIKYALQYSDNGIHWTYYMDDDDVTVKMFDGNSNNNSHARNYIYPPIFTRFIRVVPKRWWNSITMRLELLGCDFE